ncbi:hypothetical protein ACFOY5_10895 [Massilia aurea]|uniref:hypothetical protein n=1 Tax=Massilia aurea TaxID=373040 RepID=UPI0021631129|nr:hypothetical protein [Massilia aurea]MCS0709435.1 hypothetical protein [Massilia aurea]
MSNPTELRRYNIGTNGLSFYDPDGVWVAYEDVTAAARRAQPEGISIALREVTDKLAATAAENLSLGMENRQLREQRAERAQPEGEAPQADRPKLTVWYGSLPESNGKMNFTATLLRAGKTIMDGGEYTFDTSEYPDRVRYSADCMRHLIGELANEPDILDYDDEKHSGYVAPATSLSPLCGAQHAESGKEADAAEKAAAYDELNRIAELHGFASAAAAIAAARRVTQQATPAPRIIGGQPWSKEAEMTEGWLAAQQAAAPEQFCDANCVWTDHHKDCTISAPGTPEAPKPPFPISDDEIAALRRFWECATDGEGYDVEKSMMQRLAEMGLVQRKSGAYYMATDFGLYILGEYTIQRAAQLDGGQEGSESNG